MTNLNIDSHYKVRVTFFVVNQFGETLKECKKQFSPSYYKRGIKKWFFNHGIVKQEEIEIKPAGQNAVIAVATYATC